MAQNANLNKQPIGLVNQIYKVGNINLGLVETDSGITHLFNEIITSDLTILIPTPSTPGVEFKFLWSIDQPTTGGGDINFIFQTTDNFYDGGIEHQHAGNNQANFHDAKTGGGDQTYKLEIARGSSTYIKASSNISFLSDGQKWIITGLVISNHDDIDFTKLT